MMSNYSILLAEALDMLLADETLHTVTAFCSPLSNVKQRVRVTRAKNGNGFHIDIGKPNYAERAFLKQCKKAKCLPRRHWLKSLPAKRKAA
jgi:hypothetical protein